MDYEVALERVEGSFDIDLTTLDEVDGARILVSSVDGQSAAHRQVMTGDEVLSVASVDVASRGLEGVATAVAEIERLEELYGATSFTWRLRRSQPAIDAGRVPPWGTSSVHDDSDFLEMESLASERSQATPQDNVLELEPEPEPEPEPELKPESAREPSAENVAMCILPREQSGVEHAAVLVHVTEASRLAGLLLRSVSELTLATINELPVTDESTIDRETACPNDSSNAAYIPLTGVLPAGESLHDLCVQLTPLLKRLLRHREQHGFSDSPLKATTTDGLAENAQASCGSDKNDAPAVVHEANGIAGRPRLPQRKCQTPNVVLTLTTTTFDPQGQERRPEQGQEHHQGREMLRLAGKAGVERVLGRGLYGLPVDPKLPRQHIRLFFGCDSDRGGASSPRLDGSPKTSEAPGWAVQTLGKTAALVERTCRSSSINSRISDSGTAHKQLLSVPLAPAFLKLQSGDILYHRRVWRKGKAGRAGGEAGEQDYAWQLPMVITMIDHLSGDDDDDDDDDDDSGLSSAARAARASAASGVLSEAEPIPLTARLRKLQEARRRLDQQRLNQAQSANESLHTVGAGGSSSDTAESGCSSSAEGNTMSGTEQPAGKACASATDALNQRKQSGSTARSLDEKRSSSTRRVRSIRAARAATRPPQAVTAGRIAQQEAVADVTAGKRKN